MTRKPRQSLSKKTRFEVFKRDKFTCQYCGRSAPEVVLHVDHIKPVSKEGEDDLLNLVTACLECNAGKGARELDDDSAIQKRKTQLDELQDRREQIEMMLEWQRGLTDLKDQELESAAELWGELVPGYSLNENGRQGLKKSIGRFGFSEVLDAMRTAAQQYLQYDGDDAPTAESANRAYDFIGRIAAARQRAIEKPWMQELYYIRGIMRNRFTFFRPYTQQLSMAKMEKAYRMGVPLERIKDLAREARNWSTWDEWMDAEMAEYGG